MWNNQNCPHLIHCCFAAKAKNEPDTENAHGQPWMSSTILSHQLQLFCYKLLLTEKGHLISKLLKLVVEINVCVLVCQLLRFYTARH